MLELVCAKQLLDELEKKRKDFEFDVELGCQDFCELPLRFGIPCRCWMAHFCYCGEPILLSLFHPRWLFDGPPALSEPWKMGLNNVEYDQSIILEDRYKGDRFAGRGNQLIIDTALLMAEKHANLPPGEAAKFAIAFKDINDTLANRQDKKLKGKEVLPSRLPDKIIGPKLIFGPGRKRALTGREIADQQEADAARARRKAERLAKNQNDIEDTTKRFYSKKLLVNRALLMTISHFLKRCFLNQLHLLLVVLSVLENQRKSKLHKTVVQTKLFASKKPS